MVNTMASGSSRSSSKKRLTNGSNHPSNPSKVKETDSTPEQDSNCMRKFSAVLTRLLFALHAGIALWRVSLDYPTEYLYFLAIGLGCLLVEMVFTLAVRQGREYKWFCPSVLFYLMSVVPCLWLMELARLDRAMTLSIQAGVCNNTMTSYNSSFANLRPAGLSTGSSSNRTRRDLAGSEIEGFEQTLQQSNILMDRIRRETIEDDNSTSGDRDDSRRGKRKRKEKRQRKPKMLSNLDAGSENVSLSPVTKSDNGTETESPTNLTDIFTPENGRTETLLPLDTSRETGSKDYSTDPPGFATSTVSGDGINFNNLGDKIKDGFSNIEKETANLLNKTKEEVTQFVGRLTKSVDAATWILLLHQVLLFVLVIGRWLLPKGEITRDQLSQLLLVFIGVGADILEFVTETIDSEEVDPTNCNLILHYVIYGVWSWSLLQFTLVLTASKSRKTRVGFVSRVVTTQDGQGCCAGSLFGTAQLWGILVTLFLQDVPFLATRLYILIVFDLKHQMMIFFTGKNTLVVILQIYRIIVLKLERKVVKRDPTEDEEMQPLRGTLVRLARRATMAADASPNMPENIRDATFKAQKDGSVMVKIRLEGEETMRKNRKKSSPL